MRSLVFAATFLAAGVTAMAQTPSASIVGRVTDPTGAVIPAVTIKVTNLDTNISQQSSSNEVGDFTIPYLNPGKYTLQTTNPGFRSYKHSEFTLAVDQVLRIDIPLEVGAATRERDGHRCAAGVEHRERRARRSHQQRWRSPRCRSTAATSPTSRYLTGGVIPKGDGGDGQYAVNGARADNISFTDRRHEQHAAAEHLADDQPADRRRAGVQDDDLRLLGRIRPLCRRRAERGHEERHQPAARHALRVSAQRRVGRARLFRLARNPSCAGTSSAPPSWVRCACRRCTTAATALSSCSRGNRCG